MSDPDPREGDNVKPGGIVKLAVALLVALCVGLAIYWTSGDRGGGFGGGGGAAPELQETLDLTRTALAATENLEMVQADQAWTSLFDAAAQDPSVTLNRAINRVLRVDQLSGQATSASLDDDKKKAARMQLPEAISEARLAINDYGQ